MKIVDFLKDKTAFAVAYLINTVVITLIMYLVLKINKVNIIMENIIYAFSISIVIFALFLIYEYLKTLHFNKQLRSIVESKHEVCEKAMNLGTAQTMEEMLFKAAMMKVYKCFEEKIDRYSEAHKQYIYFVNQWVHQMKTPVSVINLIIEDQEENNKEIFKSIEEENDKIFQGLNIMLYNARLNEFNHDFNVELLEIVPVLRKVINDNKKSLIYNSIFPKVIEKNIMVETDRKWIYFVINQIFINAIKYTKIVEREKRTISFRIIDEETKVILSIEDNGIGIPKEDISRVFDAFFTGKNGRKSSQSTGMGMYLSKRICVELGHELRVESQEGVGSKFCIVFYRGKNIFKL